MSRRALALSMLLAACSGGHGKPSAAQTTFVASPTTIPGDGEHIAQLTLTVRDSGGHPVPDEPVTITVSVPDIAPTPSTGATNEEGIFSTTVSATSGGTILFFATVGDFQVQTSVTFTLSACAGILQLVAPEIPDGGVFDGGVFQSVWSTGKEPPGWMQTADFNEDGDGDLAVLVPNSQLIMIFLGQGNGELQEGPTIQLAATPFGLAVGDLNGDGRPDLVESEPNVVNVFLGLGDGEFQPAVATLVSGVNGPLVVGSFSGSGQMDVAVLEAETVALLPGLPSADAQSVDTAGKFEATVLTPLGVPLSNLVPLDANGDGTLDLAITSATTNSVLVLLGIGGGEFAAASTVTVGQGPVALVAGDVNGDGLVDLAVANAGDATITVALGNGKGSFQTAATLPGWNVTNPQALAATDFDTDGLLDLAIADQDGGDVALMLNTGDGGFMLASGVSYGGGPAALLTGAFAVDGTANLMVGAVDIDTVGVLVTGCTPTPQWATIEASPSSVAANGTAPITLTVTVRDNQGNPIPGQIVSLSTPVLSAADGGTTAVTLTPGDGTTGADGTFTVTATSSTPGAETVIAQVGEVAVGTSISFLGECTSVPSFTEQASAQSNSNPVSVLVSDFDEDGNLDFASGTSSGLLCVSFGSGDGGFEPSCVTTANPVNAMVTADFYGNGGSCLATAGGNVVSLDPVLPNQTVVAPTLYVIPDRELTALVTADFNNDGRPDLAAVGTEPEVTVLLNAGNGTFAQANAFVTDDPASLVAADFNHDGNADLAIMGLETVTVALGNGDGSFSTGSTITLNASPSAIITADFDGDGVPDLSTIQTGLESIAVMLGKGDGTFAAPVITSLPFFPTALVATSFSGDTHLDVLVGNGDSVGFSVLLGNGDGTFQPFAAPTSLGATGTALAVGDFYGDGLPDVVVACPTDQNGDPMSGFVALERASCAL